MDSTIFQACSEQINYEQTFVTLKKCSTKYSKTFDEQCFLRCFLGVDAALYLNK